MNLIIISHVNRIFKLARLIFMCCQSISKVTSDVIADLSRGGIAPSIFGETKKKTKAHFPMSSSCLNATWWFRLLHFIYKSEVDFLNLETLNALTHINNFLKSPEYVQLEHMKKMPTFSCLMSYTTDYDIIKHFMTTLPNLRICPSKPAGVLGCSLF